MNPETLRYNPRLRPAYRADVDGLRAIAVAGVILFHVDQGYLLPGGFLGVDVFLVISGFVISRVLICEITEGTFSLLKFYRKRFWRIFPLLSLVVLVTSITLLFAASPAQIQQGAVSGAFSLFGVSNFYFWLQDPYWAPDSELQPFLHTWSLGLEEQYYLLFPLILVFFFKRFSIISIIAIFAFLITGSLVFSHYMSSWDGDLSFYLLPTRIWEFLIGAVLAFVTGANEDYFKDLPRVQLG